MSSTPPASGRLLVESLEARIAPTGLTAIANNLSSSSQDNYVTYNTAPSANHLGFVKASTLLGASAPANLYAIKLTGDGSVNAAGLSNGDALLIFNSTTGFNPNFPSLQATNKTVIAFFQDGYNGGQPGGVADGQVQANELVGISLTKKSGANVNGNVYGDIVTNLSKDGSTLNVASAGKAGFNITGLNINGNVNGNILAGGSINNLTVGGSVGNVLAGTATNNVAYNLTGVPGAVTGTITGPTLAVGQAGASITNVSITSLLSGQTLHSGDGGLGGLGGGVSSVAITADTGAFNITAGKGGFGNDTTPAGAGGDISGVTVVGVAGTTANQLISMHAGDGGDNPTGKGGAGGAIIGVATSFNSFDPGSNSGVVSPDLLTQNILVQGGHGGFGRRGGAGGDVMGSQFFNAAPDDGVVSAAGANAEVQVIGGNGGAPAIAGHGHGGAGGSVSQVFAEDLTTDGANPDGTSIAATDSVLVQGGTGGVGRGGGNLDAITLLGARLIANAGNGTDGKGAGGAGGSLDTITIANLTNLFTHQLTLNAGSGGAAQTGVGGNGGNINAVSMLDSDLSLLVINDGNHANGGVGNGGAGGAGGTITNVQFNDSDANGQFANVTVRSGLGADGLTGGGAGGDINNLQMFGLNFNYSVTAGTGGSILNGGQGLGGAGGSLNTVGFSSVGNVDTVAVGTHIQDVLNTIPGSDYTLQHGTAIAGTGGNGTTGGGAGGSLTTVDLRATFDLVLKAGNGGTGGDGVGGDGGAIANSAGVSLGGAFSAVAGNGAGSGSGPTAGGTIANVIASAQTGISMIAGDGGVGGNGGDITGSGTTPNPLYFNFASDGSASLTTSNFGDVTIKAGAGSASGGVAGTGGSVMSFTGSIGLGGSGSDDANFQTHTTSITAGAGGGGTGDTASGAGGIVNQIQLSGNNPAGNGAFLGIGQIVTIDGGAAGQATAAKQGAVGGSVTNATLFNLDTATVVQHIAAGDGASGVKRGGAGGSITEIHVGSPGDAVADIGVRSGVAFGYDPGVEGVRAGFAGGLFAGVGGTGKKLTGLNGNVTNITAAAISSIVAGKGSTIHLVNTVDGINLEGNTSALADATGSFTNLGTANVVGSIYNNGNGAAGANASTFKQGDGLIAATTITNNRNFTPEAALTFNIAGTLEIFDLLDPATTAATPTVTVSTTIPVAYAL